MLEDTLISTFDGGIVIAGGSFSSITGAGSFFEGEFLGPGNSIQQSGQVAFFSGSALIGKEALAGELLSLGSAVASFNQDDGALYLDPGLHQINSTAGNVTAPPQGTADPDNSNIFFVRGDGVPDLPPLPPPDPPSPPDPPPPPPTDPPNNPPPRPPFASDDGAIQLRPTPTGTPGEFIVEVVLVATGDFEISTVDVGIELTDGTVVDISDVGSFFEGEFLGPTNAIQSNGEIAVFSGSALAGKAVVSGQELILGTMTVLVAPGNEFVLADLLFAVNSTNGRLAVDFFSGGPNSVPEPSLAMLVLFAGCAFGLRKKFAR